MITKNVLLYIKFLCFFWITEIFLRLAYMCWQWSTISTSTGSTIFKAFFIGLRFDGRIAVIISFPLLAFLFTPILKCHFDKIRKPLQWFYTAVFSALIFVYEADFAHYSYLQIKLNFQAITLLKDVKESILMVWQTYNVIPILFATLVITWGANHAIRKIFTGWSLGTYSNKQKAVSGIICTLIVLIVAYGQYTVNYFPLRWSQAYFSGYNEITALALNPIQNIYDTKPVQGIAKFDKAATNSAYPLLADYLKLDNPDQDKLRFDRFNKQTKRERPNVVIIVMESMSTHRSSFMYDELPTTPFLKSLASESLYFPNYYASARTTAKAMFSITTGIPDGNAAYETSSRDQGAVDQHIVWNEFDGYNKFFMMGGDANWANIRGILSNNISNLKLYEESYWKSPRSDVWGISDLDLLRESHDIFAEQNEPFVAVILTAAFHRPFTIPKNVEGFDYTMPSTEFIEKYGFLPEEYLSMRFCDFAVQKFFDLAKKSSYYDNTIFIITGDHGIAELSPAAPQIYQQVRLHEYQVPLIIHYPKNFPKGKVMMQAGGHADLFPTVAGLVGIPYHNTTLGRDLLDPKFGADRWTFVMRSYTTPVILNGEYNFVADDSGSGVLYHRTPNAIAEDWKPVETDNARLEDLAKLANGIKETARYLLYHNTKSAAEEIKKAQN